MTLFGWDMSHYDAPNIGKAVNEGISFIVHKAGGDKDDPELATWWDNVKHLPDNIVLGTYWIPRPDLHPDAKSAANDYIATLDAACDGWRNRIHMLQMDAERWPQGDKTKPSRSYLQAMGNQLVAKMPKLQPMCYASRGQYLEGLKGLTFPLWNARYPSDATGPFKLLYAAVGGDKGSGWLAYSGQVPKIWQYTSKATIGGQTTCDANAFRGTLEQLVALVAPGWVDDMAISDDDVKRILNNDNTIAAPTGSKNPDGSPNPFWSLSSYMKLTYAAAITAKTNAANALIAAQAALAAVKTNDIKESAAIASLVELVKSMAAQSGALTPAELTTLTDQLKQVANDAGDSAAARVEGEIQALRRHLGDVAE